MSMGTEVASSSNEWRQLDGLSTTKRDYVEHPLAERSTQQATRFTNESKFEGLSTTKESFPVHPVQRPDTSPAKTSDPLGDGRGGFQGCSVMKTDYVWHNVPHSPREYGTHRRFVNPAKFEGESTMKAHFVAHPLERRQQQIQQKRRHFVVPDDDFHFDLKLEGCSTTKSTHVPMPPSRPDPLPKYAWTKKSGKFFGASTTKSTFVAHQVIWPEREGDSVRGGVDHQLHNSAGALLESRPASPTQVPDEIWQTFQRDDNSD